MQLKRALVGVAGTALVAALLATPAYADGHGRDSGGQGGTTSNTPATAATFSGGSHHEGDNQGSPPTTNDVTDPSQHHGSDPVGPAADPPSDPHHGSDRGIPAGVLAHLSQTDPHHESPASPAVDGSHHDPEGRVTGTVHSEDTPCPDGDNDHDDMGVTATTGTVQPCEHHLAPLVTGTVTGTVSSCADHDMDADDTGVTGTVTSTMTPVSGTTTGVVTGTATATMLVCPPAHHHGKHRHGHGAAVVAPHPRHSLLEALRRIF